MSRYGDKGESWASLQECALQRLGFHTQPSIDLVGLRAVYSAWCTHVPFDNVRKMIALRRGDRPLPGCDVREFFVNWLADGTGGTCWPTSNALFTLLRSLGFEARRLAGHMRDLGVVNHASVMVRIDGREWLVDSSVLCNIPLPLRDEVFVSDDPVFTVEVEASLPTHVVWSHTPPNSAYLPCRIHHPEVSHEYYLQRYEESRTAGPFNQRLYARRNPTDEMIVFVGNERFSKTKGGLESRKLSPKELCEALRDEVGLSDGVVSEWVQSGGLADSLRPPTGPKPPPVLRKPPSQRVES